MTRILVLAIFAIETAVPALAEDCGVYLDSQYAYSSIFSSKRDDIKLSMRIEPGSIEALHPGVIRRLIMIREMVQKFSRKPNPVTLAKARNYSYANLQALYDDIYDRRFREMVASTMGLVQSPKEQNFHSLLATLWELTMACAFSGEEIILNGSISEIYPNEFHAVESRLPGRNFKIDREIDIAILNRDGSWRWIEVKDWSILSNGHRYSHRKLLEQSRAQDSVRRALKLDIKMILLLKYGMNNSHLEEVRLNSRHQEIHFVFPLTAVSNQ